MEGCCLFCLHKFSVGKGVGEVVSERTFVCVCASVWVGVGVCVCVCGCLCRGGGGLQSKCTLPVFRFLIGHVSK